MKNNIYSFALIGCITGMLSAGCGKTSEQKVEIVKENARDAQRSWRETEAETSSDWLAFVRESDEGIEANEKRIDAFKKDIEKAGSKVSAKYSKDVTALEQKNRDMKKKLNEYKDEGPAKWEEFKTNFKHDMDGMEKTMTDLFKDKT